MNKLSQLFNSNHRVGKMVKEWTLTAQLKAQKNHLLGQLSAQLDIRFLRRGVLHLETHHYVWVNEIRRHRQIILSKANAVLGISGIRDLKVHYIKKQSKKAPTHDLGSPKGNLNSQILALNEERQQKGYQLCHTCHAVYTPQPVCVFCISDQDYQDLRK